MTILKNELLCWLTKMLRVLHCGRLGPAGWLFWMGSQSGTRGFRTLWMAESCRDLFCSISCYCSFFLLLHTVHIPLVRTQLCPFILFHKSFYSDWISISLLFIWCSSAFSLSHVCGLSLLLHYGIHITVCVLCLPWHHFRLSPITSINILIGIYRKDLPLLFHLSGDSHSAE